MKVSPIFLSAPFVSVTPKPILAKSFEIHPFYQLCHSSGPVVMSLENRQAFAIALSSSAFHLEPKGHENVYYEHYIKFP